MGIGAIIALAAQIGQSIWGIVTGAIAAHEANNQAGLDAAHTSLLAMANAVRPAGTAPLT